MKNTSFRLGLPYFFRKQPQGISSGTLPVAVKLGSERQRTESILEDILRWADDGGQMPEPGSLSARSTADRAREQPEE